MPMTQITNLINFFINVLIVQHKGVFFAHNDRYINYVVHYNVIFQYVVKWFQLLQTQNGYRDLNKYWKVRFDRSMYLSLAV